MRPQKISFYALSLRGFYRRFRSGNWDSTTPLKDGTNYLFEKIKPFGLLKFVLPVLVLLFIYGAANAQTYTKAEQQCFDMAQGKVAWNKAGTSTTWNEVNLRNLCEGATNAATPIACFISEINKTDNWTQAIQICKTRLEISLAMVPGTYQRDPVENNWHIGSITQDGGNLRWTNKEGVSWKLIPDLANRQLLTDRDSPYYGQGGREFKLIVTGGRITGFQFLGETYNRQNTPAVSGKWNGYFKNGTAAQNLGTITQNGSVLTIDNGDGVSTSVSKGSIEDNKIIATDWRIIGTLSSDGKKITWSNETTWVKQEGLKSVNISFANKTRYQVEIFWINTTTEKLYSQLKAQESYQQQTYQTHKWSIRYQGNVIAKYTATEVENQNVRVEAVIWEAGPIWNQKDAETKCQNATIKGLWTGAWWTTEESKMSVCEIIQIQTLK